MVTPICIGCVSYDVFTIYTHEAMYRLGLTDKELRKAKLRKIKYIEYGYSREAYFIPDVLQLADKLTKNCEPSDPKRKKYIKERRLYDEICDEFIPLITRRKGIVKNLEIAIEKYDIAIDLKDPTFVDIIDEHTSDLNLTAEQAIHCILIEIEQLIPSFQRMEQINAKICNLVPEEFIEKLCDHYRYLGFINGTSKLSLDETVRELIDYIDMLEEKRRKIDGKAVPKHVSDLTTLLNKSGCDMRKTRRSDEFKTFEKNGKCKDISQVYCKIIRQSVDDVIRDKYGATAHDILKDINTDLLSNYKKGRILKPDEIAEDIFYKTYLTNTFRWKTTAEFNKRTHSKPLSNYNIFDLKVAAKVIDQFIESRDEVLEIHHVRNMKKIRTLFRGRGLFFKVTDPSANDMIVVVSKI